MPTRKLIHAATTERHLATLCIIVIVQCRRKPGNPEHRAKAYEPTDRQDDHRIRSPSGRAFDIPSTALVPLRAVSNINLPKGSQFTSFATRKLKHLRRIPHVRRRPAG